MTTPANDSIAWARSLAAAYPDIAMIIRFEPASAELEHIGLVMKDGGQTPWFATGKGVDGLAWSTVPGRDVLPQLLSDERVRQPGVRIHLSFCDTRALLFSYEDGRERIAGEEVVDAPYRMLYPEPGQRPALEEFFLHWGEPVESADRAPTRE